jgi:hypothetical protein
MAGGAVKVRTSSSRLTAVPRLEYLNGEILIFMPYKKFNVP